MLIYKEDFNTYKSRVQTNLDIYNRQELIKRAIRHLLFIVSRGYGTDVLTHSTIIDNTIVNYDPKKKNQFNICFKLFGFKVYNEEHTCNDYALSYRKISNSYFHYKYMTIPIGYKKMFRIP